MNLFCFNMFNSWTCWWSVLIRFIWYHSPLKPTFSYIRAIVNHSSTHFLEYMLICYVLIWYGLLEYVLILYVLFWYCLLAGICFDLIWFIRICVNLICSVLIIWYCLLAGICCNLIWFIRICINSIYSVLILFDEICFEFKY